MTIIYAVNSGSYSDYGIDAVFSTKEKAKQFMEKFPKAHYSGYNDIEEWELDKHIKEIDKGLTFYRLIMYQDGEVREIAPSDHPSWHNDSIHWSISAYWKPTKPWANFYVWAKDEKHATKIANERRIMSLAQPSQGKSEGF